MFHDGWGLGGMHLLWWLFWILLIVGFFALLEPTSKAEARRRRMTPLDILQRRYAAGELTTEEYEERKARLERAASQ